MRISRPVVIGVAGVVVVALVVVGLGGALGWFAGSSESSGGSGSSECGRLPALPGQPPEPGNAPEVELPPSAVQPIATGLCVPWGLAFLPDGTALVSERRTGRIMSVTSAGEATEAHRLSGLPDIGEVGLLGLAVSPTYATDQLLYIYYTSDRDNRIARLRLGEEPEPILTGIPRTEFHAGGRLAFGPDGMLYASTGEAYENPEIAQDLDSLGGKILRITPNGEPAPGNPIPGSPVYSFGHRNVEGLAFDSAGRLFASELGEDRFDELNLIHPGGNYGWPLVEGVANDPRFIDPIVTWAPAEASPAGIAIVGDQIYIACLRGQRLIRVGLDGSNPHTLLVGDYGRLRTVTVAPDGSLWVTTSNRDQVTNSTPADDDDRILRVAPPTAPA
jgi:glucose/arabinose dehydrogenase